MRATVARFLPLIVTILAPTLAAAQPSGGPVPVAATGSMAKAHGKELTASALSTGWETLRLRVGGQDDQAVVGSVRRAPAHDQRAQGNSFARGVYA